MSDAENESPAPSQEESRKISTSSKTAGDHFASCFSDLQNDHIIDAGELHPDLVGVDCVAGIDEAGRGPVLGPMVYAIAACPLAKYDQLKALEVADSKQLTEEQRDELFDKINEIPELVYWSVHILHPAHISKNMLGLYSNNLNSLSHNSAFGLVRHLGSKGIKVKQLFVDTVGPPAAYQAKFEKNFPSTETTVTPKADDLFPIVSAASICAKVCRDWVCANWKFEIPVPEDMEYGCGYPSDGKTTEWLDYQARRDPVFAFPNFVRFSWSTAQKIIGKRCVALEWVDEEEDEKKSRKRPANNTSLDCFFSKPKLMRQYFTNVRLSDVSSL